MQRIDVNEKKPRRITLAVTTEQAEYIDALIEEEIYDSAAAYIRHLIELDMGEQ